MNVRVLKPITLDEYEMETGDVFRAAPELAEKLIQEGSVEQTEAEATVG